MYENETRPQRALLVSLDTGEYDAEVSLGELEELAHTAGAEPVLTLTQKRPAPDTATCIGSGMVEQAAQLCQQEEIDLLIFDRELTPTQIRNLEKACGVQVIDRTTLILDIFAQRARSKEGKLQVELAQLKYLLPRLGGQGTSLSRLGGGIGTRGPGETKLETDRRHIRSRIQKLEEELEELGRRRQRQRARRKKDGVPTAAIVGYTNVGKSTLLNALTDAGVLAEDKLFATLDPTARALLLPDGRSVMLVDTVGLVRRLPHQLVEAFRSTLEEATDADVLLLVCDASSPEMEEQLEVTTQLLAELGAGDTPVVRVLNKCDLTPWLRETGREDTVLLSAREGWGLDRLVEAVARALTPTQTRMTLLLPYDRAGLLAEVRRDGKVFSEEYLPEGIRADALVDEKVAHLVARYREQAE